MAHKTLIGGTAYDINGGKTLINGTAYSIKSGKTLVDGTGYEVGFAPDTTILALAGRTYQYDEYTSLHIRYTKPDGSYGELTTADGNVEESYEFPVGTTISIESEYMTNKHNQYILLNGEQISYSDNYCSYTHTLTVPTLIESHTDWTMTKISITEIPGDGIFTVIVDEVDTSYAEIWLKDDSLLYGGTYQFPLGTVLRCWIGDGASSSDYDGVYVNGVRVASAPNDGSTTYNYVLRANARIVVGANTYGYEEGRIEITEIP